MRAILLLLVSSGLLTLGSGSAVALTVRRSPSSSGAVIVEITGGEAKAVIADPNNARRLAAGAGYRMLVLLGIPVPVIGETAFSKEGGTLLDKYSADIARCARYHDAGFTLEYDIDVERIRKTWQMSGSGGQSDSGGPSGSILSDIIRQLTTATPRFSCPEI